MDSECARELEEETKRIAKKFKNWQQMEESRAKMKKLVDKLVRQGMAEEEAVQKAEDIYHKTFLEKATKKVQERYEEKKNSFQSQLEMKRAEFLSRVPLCLRWAELTVNGIMNTQSVLPVPSKHILLLTRGGTM